MLRGYCGHTVFSLRNAGLLLFACAVLCVQGCGKNLVDSGAPVRFGAASGAAVVKTARTQIGAPYKHGGASPKTGFDCSGFIVWSYQQYGIAVPRRAVEQARYGRVVKKSQLRYGDIVIFRVSGSWHTGLYTGGDKFIHSPSAGKKIREDSINDDYWKRRYYSARRVL